MVLCATSGAPLLPLTEENRYGRHIHSRLSIAESFFYDDDTVETATEHKTQ